MEIRLQAKLVGREAELGRLKSFLERAEQGQGNLAFIIGEAGIGKSKLVNELREIAQSKGFQTFYGNGIYESLTPYMPFQLALQSGGMEALLAEESPRIEAVYLVTDNGLLVREVFRSKPRLDPDLFASMLSAVGNFMQESLSMLSGEERDGALNVIGYERYRIIIESGLGVNLVAIITGRENEFLIDEMRGTLWYVMKIYGNVLKEWDGDGRGVEGVERLLEPLVYSGRFDGTYPTRFDSKARRNLLFENVVLGLIRRARDSPLLLCIEDLQWADPSTLALMHYLARSSKDHRIMILGTYRPEEVTSKEGQPHPLSEALERMRHEDLYHEVGLKRLPEQQVSEFMSALLGETSFGEEFHRRVYGETDGNPLFIIELVKLLTAEGAIKRSNGSWNLVRDLGEINIPSKIHDAISRRLNRVHRETRVILDYASIIGNTFTSNVLARAIRLDKVHVLEQLRNLEVIHRLIHTYDDAFRFDHTKIKEVLYSEIPRELRAEYHGIIAESIESVFEDSIDDVVGDLAFHYYHCRNKDKGLLYLKKAATSAKAKYSNDEAIRLLNWAIEIEDDDESKMTLFNDLGEVYNLIGSLEKSMESYRSSLKIATGDKQKSEILTNLGSVYEKKSQYDESMRLLNDALSLVEGLKCKEEVEALYNLGIVSVDRGEYDGALEYLQKGITIATDIDYKSGVASSQLNIGNINFNTGNFQEALKWYEKTLATFKEIDDQRGVARCLGNIGALNYHKGNYDSALDYYNESLAIIEKMGDQQAIAFLTNNIGVVHEDKSEYAEALESYRKSLKISERIGQQQVVGVNHHNIGKINFYLENYQEAIDQFKLSMRISERIGDPAGMAYNLIGIAEAHLKQGRLKDSFDFCNKAFKLSNQKGLKEYIASSQLILGMIRREEKDWSGSMESFEGCIRIFKEMGKEREVGKSYFEFGLMWKERGETEMARENLSTALEIFQRLRLAKETQNAERQLDMLSWKG